VKLCQILLTCILIFVVSLTNCKSKKDKDAEADSNSTEPNVAVKVSTTDEVSSKHIVVTVGGVAITKEVLEKNIPAEIEKKKVSIPPAFQEQYKWELKRKLQDDMIFELLLDEKVKQNKIVVTEKDVDDCIRQIKAKNKMSMKDFLEILEA